MAQKKAYEVEAFLKSNKAQSYPFVLIYGSDKGLVSEYASLFVENSGVALHDAFALLKLDCDLLEKDPARLIDEAQTIALFGGKRLIWLHYRGSGVKNNFSEAVRFLLEKRLQDCFILIEAGDLKKTIFLRKIIEDSAHAVALPCYADEGQAIQKLIDHVLEQFQCNITEDARSCLEFYLGADRRISRSELEKLCLYVQQSKQITLNDVKIAMSDGRALTQDDVIDAVLSGNISSFNSNFDRNLAAAVPGFVILSALIRQFQQLQNFRFQIEQQGKNPSFVLSAARPSVFFKRRKVVEQALIFWNTEKINRAMVRLQKALLESRKNSMLSTIIIRQNLLALVIEAARSKGF